MFTESGSQPTVENSQDKAYVDAVQKQQMEAEILARGEKFDQSHVDTLLSQTAIEYAAKGTPEADEAGKDMLTQLTIPETEEDTDAVIAEASRRQVELDNLYNLQNLQERATKEDWPQEKYDQEREKLIAK